MDKIEKALKRLIQKERVILKSILKQIRNGNIKNLDMKKLRGKENIFRVRKGKMRILFSISKKNDIFVLTIERRSEGTYKN